MATGEIAQLLRPEITDRQSALMARSGIMGLLLSSNNTDLAQKYERLVAATPVLSVIEEWAFPTYARDSKPNADFSLPGSLLLRRTATEIMREMGSYPDAYIYYLVTTYIPLALSHDQTFGLRTQDLIKAISALSGRAGTTRTTRRGKRELPAGSDRLAFSTAGQPRRRRPPATASSCRTRGRQ